METKLVHSTTIKTSQDLFDVFAQNNSIIIADQVFDSISQLRSANDNVNREEYWHIRQELNRLCNLIIE